jgi:hypothetical protein
MREDKTMGSNEGDIRDYPRWEKAWQNKLSDVDNLIENYYNREGRESASGDTSGLQRHIQDWFDKQPLDDETRTEFNASRGDGVHWSNRVEQRLAALHHADQLARPNAQQTQSMQQGQSGAAAGAVNTAGQAGPEASSADNIKPGLDNQTDKSFAGGHGTDADRPSSNYGGKP